MRNMPAARVDPARETGAGQRSRPRSRCHCQMMRRLGYSCEMLTYERICVPKRYFPYLPPGPRGCGGRRGGTREGVIIFGVPRLVEFLDFGLHFRHEGAERALASYKGGKASP